MNAFLFSGALTLALAAQVSAEAWDFKSADDLKGWNVVRQTEWDEPVFSKLAVNTKTGQLEAVVEHGTWYNSMTGGLLTVKRDGDFVLTTRLNVYGAKKPLPGGMFEQAGLMIRHPIADVRHEVANWEYLVTGGSEGTRIVDYKSTRNSFSLYAAFEVTGPWIELRMVRIGTKIAKLWRADGGTWACVEIQDRPDLTGPMDVGLCFLSNWKGDPPDLHVSVDWIRFSEAPAMTAVPADKDTAAWTQLLGGQ